MKAVLLKGPKDIVIDEVPVPEISDDEALLEVKYCGICGSDISSYKTTTHYYPGTYMGHKYSGVIAKVGKKDAQQRLAKLLVTIDQGIYVKPKHLTLGEWIEGMLFQESFHRLSS